MQPELNIVAIDLAKKVFHVGRCLKCVDPISKWPTEFIAVDEQPNDQIVHPLCLRKANRTTHQAFDASPKPDVLALYLLGVFLANGVLLC